MSKIIQITQESVGVNYLVIHVMDGGLQATVNYTVFDPAGETVKTVNKPIWSLLPSGVQSDITTLMTKILTKLEALETT